LSCAFNLRAEGLPPLAVMLQTRALESPEEIAYTFLADGGAGVQSVSWFELNRRAQALASLLLAENATGLPVLLALPSGLPFIEALFACWYAGAIAVPLSVPRHQRARHRLDAIIADCGAHLVIGTPEARALVESKPGGDGATKNLRWIDATTATIGSDRSRLDVVPSPHERVALLQYTSGSTGSPRGVVVTHANLAHNSALIAQACGHRPGELIGGWLPLFHDMGLIGLVVQAVTVGLRCVLMSPERFLMRPWLWLQMISDYQLCSSPAPNFAYDLCTEKVSAEHKTRLDLSRWRNALNGSEPVRSETLDRFAGSFASCGFRRSAFLPCYGLAEATLFATGHGPRRHIVRRSLSGVPMDDDVRGGYVGCGRPYGDTRIAIVDPERHTALAPRSIGEIWLTGASIAEGYWKQREATCAAFGAHIATGDADERAGVQDDSSDWLRTGDLGFIADGELFITGRLREMIIIAGRNHFPIDIERTVESADPVIAASGAVAFAIEMEGMERLIVTAEIRRARGRMEGTRVHHAIDVEALRRRIRAEVSAEHDVTPHDVALLPSGALPRTSSGKVRRLATREAYLNRTLETLGTTIDVSVAT